MLFLLVERRDPSLRTRALVIGLLSALLLALAPPRSSASTSGAERYQYVHPLPGSRLVSPRNNIVIRQGDRIDGSTIAASAIVVVGSRSGSHTGRLALSDDRKTLVFTPD